MGADRDGMLCTAEVAAGLASLGLDPTNAAVSAEGMDLDKDGFVTWTEFVAACLPMEGDQLRDGLWAVFKALDADGHGYPTRAELRGTLTGGGGGALGGLVLPAAEVDHILNHLDPDENGYISCKDLRDFVLPATS